MSEKSEHKSEPEFTGLSASLDIFAEWLNRKARGEKRPPKPVDKRPDSPDALDELIRQASDESLWSKPARG